MLLSLTLKVGKKNEHFKLNQDGYHCFNVRQMMDGWMVDDGLIGPSCDEEFWKDDRPRAVDVIVYRRRIIPGVTVSWLSWLNTWTPEARHR